MTVFESDMRKASVELDHKRADSTAIEAEVSQENQRLQADIKQVSICFHSDALNQRVHERFSKIASAAHSFIIGLHRNSSIVLTDFEEMAETALDADMRLIMFEGSLGDDEIVRRAPIRLGLRG